MHIFLDLLETPKDMKPNRGLHFRFNFETTVEHSAHKTKDKELSTFVMPQPTQATTCNQDEFEIHKEQALHPDIVIGGPERDVNKKEVILLHPYSGNKCSENTLNFNNNPIYGESPHKMHIEHTCQETVV